MLQLEGKATRKDIKQALEIEGLTSINVEITQEEEKEEHSLTLRGIDEFNSKPIELEVMPVISDKEKVRALTNLMVDFCKSYVPQMEQHWACPECPGFNLCDICNKIGEPEKPISQYTPEDIEHIAEIVPLENIKDDLEGIEEEALRLRDSKIFK